jgi:hypothetical protein
MIQRKSYHAFRSAALSTQLELSGEQQRAILSAIDAHVRRIADAETELGRATERAAQSLVDGELAAHIRRLTDEKVQKGRYSHRRVWDEIHDVLSPHQRQRFNGLRGTMPEHVGRQLPMFVEQPSGATAPGRTAYAARSTHAR